MKLTEKQPANEAFRKASSVFVLEAGGLDSVSRRNRGGRKGKGAVVLAGALVFAFLVCGILLAKVDIADARQRAGDSGTISAIEELRVAERGDIQDISETSDVSAVAVNSAGNLPSVAPASGSSGMPPAPSPSTPQVIQDSDVSPAGVSDSAPAPAPASHDLSPSSASPVTASPESASGRAAQPPEEPLATPEQPSSASSATSESQGQTQTKAVTRPDAPPEEDSYYDSLPLPPSGPLAKKTAGPREVDPKLEPASKFVIVTKDQEAGGFEALLVSANRALALGRYDASVDLFKQLLGKNSRDRRALMGYAVALQKAGRGEAARVAYEGLLKLDPGNREAQANLLGLIAQDYPAVALRRMLDLRKKWPEDAGLAAQIGLTQARLGNDHEALDYLGMAASIDPSNAGHLFNMAVIEDRLGDRDQAIKLYEQALQTDTLHGGGRSIPRDTVYSRLSVLRDQ